MILLATAVRPKLLRRRWRSLPGRNVEVCLEEMERLCGVVGSVGRVAGDENRPLRSDRLDAFVECCGHPQVLVSGFGAQFVVAAA